MPEQFEGYHPVAKTEVEPLSRSIPKDTLTRMTFFLAHELTVESDYHIGFLKTGSTNIELLVSVAQGLYPKTLRVLYGSEISSLDPTGILGLHTLNTQILFYRLPPTDVLNNITQQPHFNLKPIHFIEFVGTDGHVLGQNNNPQPTVTLNQYSNIGLLTENVLTLANQSLLLPGYFDTGAQYPSQGHDWLKAILQKPLRDIIFNEPNPRLQALLNVASLRKGYKKIP